MQLQALNLDARAEEVLAILLEMREIPLVCVAELVRVRHELLRRQGRRSLTHQPAIAREHALTTEAA